MVYFFFIFHCRSKNPHFSLSLSSVSWGSVMFCKMTDTSKQKTVKLNQPTWKKKKKKAETKFLICCLGTFCGLFWFVVTCWFQTCGTFAQQNVNLVIINTEKVKCEYVLILGRLLGNVVLFTACFILLVLGLSELSAPNSQAHLSWPSS